MSPVGHLKLLELKGGVVINGYCLILIGEEVINPPVNLSVDIKSSQFFHKAHVRGFVEGLGEIYEYSVCEDEGTALWR